MFSVSVFTVAVALVALARGNNGDGRHHLNSQRVRLSPTISHHESLTLDAASLAAQHARARRDGSGAVTTSFTAFGSPFNLTLTPATLNLDHAFKALYADEQGEYQVRIDKSIWYHGSIEGLLHFYCKQTQILTGNKTTTTNVDCRHARLGHPRAH